MAQIGSRYNCGGRRECLQAAGHSLESLMNIKGISQSDQRKAMSGGRNVTKV